MKPNLSISLTIITNNWQLKNVAYTFSKNKS